MKNIWYVIIGAAVVIAALVVVLAVYPRPAASEPQTPQQNAADNAPAPVQAENPAPADVGTATPSPSPAPVSPKTETKTVTYTDSGFSPNPVTIHAGDTVTFVNNGSSQIRVASDPHPTHTGYPTTGGCVGSTFDSCAPIAPGASWSFTFDIKGSWGYHNHFDPAQRGTVIVQ